jgi:formate dehydrogenase accessory protein FdhE
MTLFQAASSAYEQRLRRAEYLAGEHGFAAEVLNFFSEITKFQKSLYARIAAAVDPTAVQAGGHSPPIRKAFDATLLLPHFRAFLATVERHAPAPLAEAARELAAQPSEMWIPQLAAYWSDAQVEAKGESDDRGAGALPVAQFFPRAFLQPYAEFLAEQIPTPTLLETAKLCPLCGSQPFLGVLRREGDGGKRFLVCNFCAQEWEFRRLLCPTCGEDHERKLPIYVAEQFPHVRVEACETCKSYLPTIDLTKDGNAIPLVDDLAAMPLTLWAQEHGFVRRHANLLGT